jgi:hypothetical protein
MGSITLRNVSFIAQNPLFQNLDFVIGQRD